MKRRTFFRSVTAGLAAYPGVAAAAERLGQLREDLKTARDEAAFWSRLRRNSSSPRGWFTSTRGHSGPRPGQSLRRWPPGCTRSRPTRFPTSSAQLGNRMEDVRARAAEFLGDRLDEVAITENTTSGMNAVAEGISWQLRRGDEVLTTSHEHPGGMVCWENLARHEGVKIVTIPMPAPVKDKAQILQLVKDHITPRTKVCRFSHVETITGLQMPLAEIAAITRPRQDPPRLRRCTSPRHAQDRREGIEVDTYASAATNGFSPPRGAGCSTSVTRCKTKFSHRCSLRATTPTRPLPAPGT